HHRVVGRLSRGNAIQLQTRLWWVTLVGAGHLLLLLWVLLDASLSPTQSAHDAVLTTMLVYLLLHSGLAVVLTLLQALRVGYGYVGKGLPYEPMVLRPFWIYTLGVFWVSL